MRGRYAVFITLSLFILVPAVSVGIGLSLSSTQHRVKLDYDSRSDWFMQAVKSRPLKYSTFVASETGKEYKKTDLTLDPQVERTVLQCVGLARDTASFDNQTTRDQLEPIASDPAFGFYPAYLLAVWHQRNGNPSEQHTWMQAAYDRAGGAIAQRLVVKGGGPAAGVQLPPVAIGFDRVIDGERDWTLVLHYPLLPSDADGFIYLPTYRSVYRLVDPALPTGADATLHPSTLTFLPQEPDGPDPHWFAVPDGAVGQLPDALIE